MHGALLVAVSVIGAVAGSIANFVHPYVMKEKGWTGPEHKRIQRNDLLFRGGGRHRHQPGDWVVGVEILRPNGLQVNTLSDLGAALELFFGAGGWVIFFTGVFATLFASVVGKTTAFPMLIPTPCNTSVRSAANAMARPFTRTRRTSGSCSSSW